MLLQSLPDEDFADHPTEEVLVLSMTGPPVPCDIPHICSPTAFLERAAPRAGLDGRCALHVPTLCPLHPGHPLLAAVIPSDVAISHRLLVVDARRVCSQQANAIWLQEAPHVMNPVITIALLLSARLDLAGMGAFYLDCTPIRGYTELTARVSVLTLMPATLAFDCMPVLLQNSRMMRRRIGFAQLYCRYRPGRGHAAHGPCHTALTSTSTTTTSVIALDPERGARARYLFDKPVRLFVCSPGHHVETATLQGELDLDDIMAQLCIQLADSHQLQPGWTFRAVDRVVSDDDHGFSCYG